MCSGVQCWVRPTVQFFTRTHRDHICAFTRGNRVSILQVLRHFHEHRKHADLHSIPLNSWSHFICMQATTKTCRLQVQCLISRMSCCDSATELTSSLQRRICAQQQQPLQLRRPKSPFKRTRQAALEAQQVSLLASVQQGSTWQRLCIQRPKYSRPMCVAVYCTASACQRSTCLPQW